MQRDNLEKFILMNRTEFDRDIPNLKVWAEIDKSINKRPPKRLRIWRVASIAAAVSILLITGGVIGSQFSSNFNQSASLELAEIAPQYAEMEQYFNTQIDQRYQKLANYQYDQTVQEDLKQVDEMVKELKKELQKAPKGAEEQVINNLIRTYRTKIAILERVLERLPSNNQINIKPGNEEVSI